jgi:isoquinoline 1-oxidoreductase beta subunit
MSTRREFLRTSAAAGGGLLVAIQLPGCSDTPSGAARLPNPSSPVQANAWLRIDPDGSIAFLADRSEMGQGVYTSLPTLLAEELDVAVGSIRVEAAPAGNAYINTALGVQVTGGSTSVREAYEKLRRAGAEARARLVAAAAAQWNVDAATLRTDNGTVVAPSGESLTYGQLAEAAAALPAPADVELKPAGVFTQIGRARPRLDTAEKVDGTAVFGIDVKLPNMLHGAIALPPVLGGKVRSFDAAAARALPGVREVVQTSGGVVVLADSWWQARRARDALVVDWDAGAGAGLSSAGFHRTLLTALDTRGAEAKVPRNDGDVEAALASAARRMTLLYEEPVLAHATLEPQNCTVEQRGDEIHVHAPTQVQQLVQALAAAAAGVPAEKVFVHTTYLGGGFGRRLEGDFVPAAVEAMKAVNRPVKLVWTREDDTTHDLYRPAALQRCAAGLDASGKLTAWKFDICAPSPLARWAPAAIEAFGGIDPFSIEAAVNYPYAVPNVRVSYLQQELGFDVGFMRSVSHATNCFAVECFMDELASAAGQDPVVFRRALLDTPAHARFRHVLDRAAERAGWDAASSSGGAAAGQGGAPLRGLRSGAGQGVALMEGYGTYLAMIADVAMDGGRARVRKITCVVDCGQMVNPSIVEAQVQSSIVFGLSSALWGEITIEGGRVQQQNFDTYRIVRSNEMPELDIELVLSTEAPGGIGEPATALVAPAVANAVFAATGRRLSSLPLAKHGLA